MVAAVEGAIIRGAGISLQLPSSKVQREGVLSTKTLFFKEVSPGCFVPTET